LLILSGLEEPHPNTSKDTSKHGQDSVDEEICPGNSAPAPPSKALKARDFMTWGLIPVVVAIAVLLLAVLLAVLLEPYIAKNYTNKVVLPRTGIIVLL